ncbi:MAG: C40 family peptidase [Bacteroidales bacterium]|nr:C40 family peptidase [Bacteroidales bacterium]
MERYICENVFVPLRLGPTHRSEMLSQVLFGERYTIIDQVSNWLKIETEFDHYSGWIDIDHLHHTVYTDSPGSFTLNRSLLCYKSDKTKIILEAGCEIFDPDFDKHTFKIGSHIYTTASDFSSTFITSTDSPADTAMRFINSPYIWGGRIPSGMDCSGFTQLVYKIHKKPIPRNSWQQAEIGENISSIDEVKPGDLVFFDNVQGRITHVGMIISRGLVIHASGRVRIDQIDHHGIFKQEIGAYSHHLRSIRRIGG